MDMRTKPEQKKREWPKWAMSPSGERAIFQCAGDVVAGWIVDGMTEPLKRKTRDEAPLVVETISEPEKPKKGKAA